MNINDRTLRLGLGLAAMTAIISGISVFVNSFAVKELPDAGLFTTLKNGVAALVLLGVALPVLRRRGTSLRLDRSAGVRLTMIAIVGGSVPFLLFFTGLAMASAPSAAFIHKTLFIWVALLAVPFLGERLGWLQVAALGGLLASQILIVPPNGVAWGVGETMIAAATLLWSVEVILAKRLLARVDPLVVGVGRLGIGVVFLFGYLLLTGKLALIGTLGMSQWTWVLLTGVLLAGYVGTWFSALRLAPATVVTSVLVLAAPITASLDVVFNGKVLAQTALTGYGLVLMAAALLVVGSFRARRIAAPLAA
jgi:drug/metabolite transporter (DMT)-like permease